jgi:tetratricopeptide (TPR) repeat protein
MANSYSEALRYRAVEAFKAEDYDSAISSFDELTQLTEHVWDRQWRAITLLLLGRYTEAYADFLRVLESYPDDTTTLNYLAYINAGCPDSSSRDGKKAIKYATRACELSSWKYWAHLSVLAAAYAEVSDWAQAIKYGEQALGLAPDEEIPRRELALQLYRKQSPYRCSIEQDRERLHRIPAWLRLSAGDDTPSPQ